MARQHTMTPRRRAALRKAQLVSARKRRKKNTVRSAVKRTVKQRASYAKASYQANKGRKKSRKRKAVQYTAMGLSGAAAVYGGYKFVETGNTVKYAKRISEGTYEPNRRDIFRNRRNVRKGLGRKAARTAMRQQRAVKRDDRKFKRSVKRDIRKIRTYG